DLPSAVRSAVLERDVEELEKGLDTVVGPRGVKLSGGQQRRSAAARMFVRDQPERWVAWEEIARKYFNENGPLVGTGCYKPPDGLVVV
ncbi:MAG: hypothetical protein QGI75_09180, partial [Phycisphaerales bacterium]|nr:hypothetical protein [Phycisphaerales bacterium]